MLIARNNVNIVNGQSKCIYGGARKYHCLCNLRTCVLPCRESRFNMNTLPRNLQQFWGPYSCIHQRPKPDTVKIENFTLRALPASFARMGLARLGFQALLLQ
jgi:hypothetical protein